MKSSFEDLTPTSPTWASKSTVPWYRNSTETGYWFPRPWDPPPTTMLGGAIIPPQLDALQITPIAPSNTNAYRCFRSSILYPANMTMCMTPIKRSCGDTLEIIVDGFDYLYEEVQKITINRSGAGLHLVRFHDYNY